MTMVSESRWPTEWDASGHHEAISAVKRRKAFSGGAETVTDFRMGGKAAASALALRCPFTAFMSSLLE